MAKDSSAYRYILAFSLIIVSIFLYCAFFAIPSADDYFYANLARDVGLWRAQIQHYIEWSGRYSATFLLTVLSMAGYQQYWLVPWVCILSLILSCSTSIAIVSQGKLAKGETMLFCLALTALFLSVSTAGKGHGIKVVNEGFFWYSGAVTYVLSLAFYFQLTTLFIASARDRFRPFLYLIFLVVTAFTIGMNETVMFLICFTIAPLLLFFRKKIGLVSLAAGLTVIAGCCALMIFAPGNGVRMATSDGGNILSAIGICFEKLFQILFFYAVNPLVWLFAIGFRPFIAKIIQLLEERRIRVRYLLSGGVTLIYLLYLPVAYSLNAGAPDRLVAFIGFFALGISIVLLHELSTFISGRWLSPEKMLVLLMLCTLGGSWYFLDPLIVAAGTVFHGKKDYAKHELRWNELNNARQKGITAVTVKPIERNTLLLFEDILPDSDNKDYAKYFGLESVRLTPEGRD
jgi:hypothetical protein